MRVGFAGLGRMGRPMALAVAAAGHDLVAFHPRRDDDPELAGAGIELTTSLSRLAATDVSISMLATVDGTMDLLAGAGGLLERAQPGHHHIVMATVDPATVRALAANAATRRLIVVDAPVSGSVAMARDATLTTMVGADAESFRQLRPLLATMTKSQYHVGPVGAGEAVKLAVNALLAAINQGVGEALALAAAEGVAAQTLYDVLEVSAAGAPYVQYKRDAFLHPDTTPVAASVELILKDLRLALSIGHDTGLPLTVTNACADVLAGLVADGLGGRDMAAVARIAEARYGTR